MHPFHFGTSDRRLFGLYHAAQGAHGSETGVVLCHPVGHEYIRSYRAMRSLANLIASAGGHVLRFDYFASGDSAGDSAERSVEQWIADTGAAVDELKDMAGVTRVSLVGLRFGATLACLAAATRDDIDELVLWDPVARGSRYLEEIRAVQADWFRTRPGPRGSAARALKNEVLGFPLPDSLIEEFMATDIRSVELRARHVTVVLSSESSDLDWREHMKTLRVPGTFLQIPSGGDWEQVSSVNRALLAHEIVQTIAARLTAHPRPQGAGALK